MIDQSNSRLRTRKIWVFALLLSFQSIILLIPLILTRNPDLKKSRVWSLHKDPIDDKNEIIPSELLHTVYSIEDFRNSYGVVPPFWQNAASFFNLTNATTTNSTQFYEQDTYGPCYRPRLAQKWTSLSKNKQKISYPINTLQRSHSSDFNSLQGLCRPGFLILGAGKSGTSSLYHYLVAHPRVLPAQKKQVHYFKFFPTASLTRYYSYFPSTTSFLSNGALMTGEAAPGYLPSPEVVNRIRKRMNSSFPKFIAILRQPLQRAYSSYRYSYLQPALKAVKRRSSQSEIGRVPKNASHDYFVENHLFSFSNFVIAELAMLKKCLNNSDTYVNASDTNYVLHQPITQSRPPLVDLMKSCYNNKTAQWSQIKSDNPNRILYSLPNLHLIQSLVGRGLYAFFLDWWYNSFPHDQIFVICSEDLLHSAVSTMKNLTKWLGLPPFNYTNTVDNGLFNVAGTRGYNAVTERQKALNSSISSNDLIPLQPQLKRELLEFYRHFNQKLFNLTRKTCIW